MDLARVTRRRFGSFYLAIASLIIGVLFVMLHNNTDPTLIGSMTFYAGEKIGYAIIILGGIIACAMWGRTESSADKILSELKKKPMT